MNGLSFLVANLLLAVTASAYGISDADKQGILASGFLGSPLPSRSAMKLGSSVEVFVGVQLLRGSERAYHGNGNPSSPPAHTGREERDHSEALRRP